MVIGDIVDKLIHIKDYNRDCLTRNDMEAINAACQILERFPKTEEHYDIKDCLETLMGKGGAYAK